MEYKTPKTFLEWIDQEIGKREEQIHELKATVIRNIEFMDGQSITEFTASRDSGIEELTSLYAKLKIIYEVKRAYSHFEHKIRL